MRRHVIALACILVATTTVGTWATGGGAPAPQHVSSGADSYPEKVVMHDAEGRIIGAVRLRQEGKTVRIQASLRRLSQGFHGFHVHGRGVCDPDAPGGPFTSADGHYVGDGGNHGTHDGDMPSLYVAADGTAQLSFVTDRFTLDELLGGDGSAVMVHEDPDNFANIPEDRYASSLPGESVPDTDTRKTGDSGDRVACGVLGGDDGSADASGLVTVTSEDAFFATVQRIRNDIENSDDLALVSVVNHAAAARDAGLELRPTTLIVFGNAAAGTPLIQQARTFGIDLPQKLLVWRDHGVVNVTYNDPHYLADRHGVTGQDELLDDIGAALQQLATGA